ncbi:hypothetical protein ACFL04_02500 [Patescibacteria group bacterium]
MKLTFSLLDKAIVSTIAYHDIHNYPLKESEIWRWLYFSWPAIESKPDIINHEEFLSNLKELVDKKLIETKGGYYYLTGREELVILRLERNEIARHKWEIARQGAKILRTSPFIKLIAVCNTLAINNIRRESDIDYFIVTKDKRLWTSRFVVTGALEARGLRRHGSKVKDHICLSFYLTETALDFRPLLLPTADPYFAFWIAQLVPLYDNGGWQELRRRNSWLEIIMPNAFSQRPEPVIKDTPWTYTFRYLREFFLWSWFGDQIDNYLHSAQKIKMKLNKDTLSSEPDNRVVIGKSVVKVHEADRREEYREKFKSRLEKILR